MLLSKTLLWNTFRQRTFVEQLVGGNVVLDAVLPIVLLDVEHDVGVELCKFHSLDVRFCCARCCCRKNGSYFVVELLVEIFVIDDVDFVMFCWTLRALSMLIALLSIILLSGRVVQNRCLHIFCCELC